MIRSAAVVLVALAAGGADWPQYLGPARDGTTAEPGLATAWPAGGPKVLWSKDAGAGFAGVVVAGGRGVLFHRVGGDEVIQSFDPATGKDGWKFAYRTRYADDFGFDPGPRATPLVAGGRVFALGADGDLTAVAADTGAKVWAKNVRTGYGAAKGYFGAAASPALAGGLLLVNVGGPGAGVVAFDPATGKEVWKATDDAASYSSPAVAEVGGNVRAVFLTRAGLLGLDPATGAVAFRHPFRSRLDASVNAATPLVRGGDVFLTASYGTGAALVRPKGEEVEEVWANDRSLSAHYNTPVRVGDYLYGVHGRQEGGGAELRCVAWATGEVKWAKPRFGCAALVAAGDVIFALAEGGELVRFAADPAAYSEQGRAAVLNSPARAAPAVSDGRLFARDEKKLVAIGLK